MPKWPSDVFLRQLYCDGGGYAACKAAKQKLGVEAAEQERKPLGARGLQSQ